MGKLLDRRKAKQADRKAKPGDQFRAAALLPPDEHAMYLAPQAEAPRSPSGQDRSSARPRGPVELSWSRFDKLVAALALEVRDGFRPTAVVGVAHGGVFVGGALASALNCDFFPVRISRRSRDKVVRKSPRLFGEMPKELAGETVLVVDDVAQSGDTLELACALAEKAGAKEVRSCALVRREGGYQPDFYSLDTEDVLVFPWDYDLVAEDERFQVKASVQSSVKPAPQASTQASVKVPTEVSTRASTQASVKASVKGAAKAVVKALAKAKPKPAAR